MKTMLFNPYSGKPRDPRDIASDPSGILMLDPDDPVRAAQPIQAQDAAPAVDAEAVAWLITGPFTRQTFPMRDSADAYLKGLTTTHPEGNYKLEPLYPEPVHLDSGAGGIVRAAGPTDAERALRRMLCLIYSRGLAYTDDGELSDSQRHPSIDFLRDAPAAIEAKITQRNTDSLVAPTQTVLCEHSGCGSNTQVDSLTVRLNPGDKVVLHKGRTTQGFDRATILASTPPAPAVDGRKG